MANLKEIRNRIASVSSTMQITSAMKMVSAAKLKKAQDAITAMRPYSDKLTELIQNLSSSIDGDTQNPYTERRAVQNVLIIAITSNRGLCGGFNSSVIKEVTKKVETTYANKNVSLITLGKKGNDILQKSFSIEENNNDIFDQLTFSNASEIAESIMKAFTDKKFDLIEVVYNRFKNAATQIVTTETLLPIISTQNENTTTSTC